MIACGEIKGDADSDGTLLIDLEEVDDSGYVGRVYFEPSKDHDDKTEVITGVWEGELDTLEASPTPVS